MSALTLNVVSLPPIASTSRYVLMTNVSPELAGELSDVFLEAADFTGLPVCFLEAPGPSRTRRPVNAKLQINLNLISNRRRHTFSADRVVQYTLQAPMVIIFLEPEGDLGVINPSQARALVLRKAYFLCDTFIIRTIYNQV